MTTLIAPAQTALHSLAQDARAEALRIIAWWKRHSVDHANGGFFGAVSAENTPMVDADKAIVLNTRILWFFSEAARLTGDIECLALANRAADYIQSHFWDAENGGLYWMVNATGQPIDRRKQAYAQAFGLYAYAAHAAATGQGQSLHTARTLFDLLEQHFYSPQCDGYWEALGHNFEPIADVRLSDRDLNAPLTMNTHLHVLEAYTRLYTVWPHERVAHALRQCLRIFTGRIVDQSRGHLISFFNAHWQSLGDSVSFGHDIEASWLLCEAAQALGDPQILAETRAIALSLAESTLQKGVGPDGEVFEEMSAQGHLGQDRVWWIQGEALVGFLNAFALSAHAPYLDAAIKLWRYIQSRQIDPNAEWHALSAPGASHARDLMAGPWKCPYHTGRAMFETEHRARTLLGDAEVTPSLS